jgi:hypothetical protein
MNGTNRMYNTSKEHSLQPENVGIISAKYCRLKRLLFSALPMLLEKLLEEQEN